MQDIAGTGYKQIKNVWEDFEIQTLGKYHDLFVQNNTLLPADILENSFKKCFEIFELDLAYFCQRQD